MHKKIGILRANALGDFILTLPALWALRSQYPAAEIVLIGRKLHQELFEERKGPMDRIVALPPGICFDRAIENLNFADQDFLAQLQSEEFDILIQLHGGGEFSNRFIKSLKSKLSIGACTPLAEKLDRSLSYVQFQHEIIRQLEVLSLLGLKHSEIVPRFPITQSDQRRGKEFLQKIFQSKKLKQFVLVNPGASDPKRRWPIEKFIKLSQSLLDLDLYVLVNLGAHEADLGKEFLRMSPEAHLISPNLSQLVSILSLCSLVISNDTGTYHLAQAMDVPTVVLFWHKNLLSYGPMTSHRTKVLVGWRTHCPTCGASLVQEPCAHGESIIDDIKQEDVFSACCELLSRRTYVPVSSS
jgi:ADP-heptose:LPS heptosyltransferase